MSTSGAEQSAAKRTIPTAEKYHQVDVTTSSAEVLYSAMTAVNTGRICTLQAAGGDVYLVGAYKTGFTVVTPSTADSATDKPGFKISSGASEDFWLRGDRLVVRGSATCKLNIWETSDV